MNYIDFVVLNLCHDNFVKCGHTRKKLVQMCLYYLKCHEIRTNRRGSVWIMIPLNVIGALPNNANYLFITL